MLAASAAIASMIALALQVWSIRLLSLLIWDQFAATVLATGLAGAAIGAWLASRAPGVPAGSLGKRLVGGFLLSGSLLIGYWFLLTTVEFEPYRALLLGSGKHLSSLLTLLGCLFVIAASTGWILAGVFSQSGLQLRKIYCADFFGGAIGVALAVALGLWIGPLAGLLLLGSCSLLWAAFLLSRGPSSAARRGSALIVLPAIAVPALFLGKGELRLPEGKLLHGLEEHVDLTIWDVSARLDVTVPLRGIFHGAGGISKPAPNDEWEYRLVTQDGGAPTAILGLAPGDVENRPTWKKYLQALPFALLDRPRVLVIGSGGGLEVAISAHFRSQSIECVEVNSSLIDLCANRYDEFQSGLFRRPEVTVHWDEGRHFVSSSDQKYDLIILAGTDSFSASTGGPNAAVENYLYTVEAVRSMLEHLSPDGVLAIVRKHFESPSESLRVFTTVEQASRELGKAAFADATFVAAGPPTAPAVSWAMILVKPAGLSEQDHRKLTSWTAEHGHAVLFDRTAPSRSYFDQYAQLDSAGRTGFLRDHPFDVTPVTDDRPYFFVSTRRDGILADTWAMLRGSLQERQGAAAGISSVVGISFSLLAAAAVLLLAVAILSAAWWSSRSLSDPVELRSWLYFALTGAGSFLAEIGLILVGTYLIGVPALAVGIVLAGVLSGAGWGALGVCRKRGAAALGVGTLLILTAAWALKLGLHWPPLSLWLGCAVLGIVSLGMGLAFGAFYPTGVHSLPGMDSPSARAKAFSVSSAFSVLGTAAAPVLAVQFGTLALLVVSTLALASAGWILLSHRHAGRHRGGCFQPTR